MGLRVLPRLLEISQKFLANEGKMEWQLSEGSLSNQQTKYFQLTVLFSLLPRHLLKYVSAQDNPENRCLFVANFATIT